MKILILSLALLSSATSHLLSALSDEDIVNVVNDNPIEGYDIDPSEQGLPASSSGFIVLNYDDLVIEGIYRILERNEYQEHWKQAFRALRRIATANPEALDYNRLTTQIIRIEDSDNIDNDTKIDFLALGYTAVARHRNHEALEFLKTRGEFDFWKDNNISRIVHYSHGAGSEGLLETAQAEAISALDEIQSDEAYALLKSLLADIRYSDKPHLLRALSASLEYGGWDASASRLQTIQVEYAKRQELRGASVSVEVIEKPAAEVPAVAEVVEEVAAPELAIEEAREAAEPTEEDVEQPSNWWLWLIGVVVIVGGIGLIARRKS